MADRFSLDEDGAHAAATRLRAAGNDLQRAHSALVEILQTRHGCWGDDEIGSKFEKNYLPSADGTRDNTALIGDNVLSVSTYIDDVTDELVQTDEDNADGLVREIDDFYADDIESWTEDA